VGGPTRPEGMTHRLEGAGGGFVPRGRGSVRFSDVSRGFKGIPVLRGVSLELRPGHIGALIGPNGSGKTTLLRIVAGLLTPDAGSVEVARGQTGEGKAGFVLAGDRGLYWRLTTSQNLEFFAGIAGLPADEARVRSRQALEALDASDLGPRRVEVCSTGQRRRIAVARGFVSCPPVVLIDEPFADLDEEGCRAVEGLCRRWVDAGGVVLYAAPVRGGGPGADVVFDLTRNESHAVTAGTS
jgi:ABC-type multidrug transport system ATPase subunit